MEYFIQCETGWVGRERESDRGRTLLFSVFLLGDVVKDRLCFPVLYSFVFSKWTPMSSCFLETRKEILWEGGDNCQLLQDQFSCFLRFHDYRAYDKHLLILENTALKFPKTSMDSNSKKQSWL